ncbi:hypothetical protein YQE_11639, partial [Dendroctonus ponderosae]
MPVWMEAHLVPPWNRRRFPSTLRWALCSRLKRAPCDVRCVYYMAIWPFFTPRQHIQMNTIPMNPHPPRTSTRPVGCESLRMKLKASSAGMRIWPRLRSFWSNKSSETPSTLDSSSFYNRSPVDEVFDSGDLPKLSLGQPASPSAILTPSSEVSDESGSSYDLRDDFWDVSQFDYDLSSLNIDGMSQLSGNFNF